MMEDLVEAPSDESTYKKRLSSRRQKRLELTRALREKLFHDVSDSAKSKPDAGSLVPVSTSEDKVEKPFAQFTSTSPKSTFLKNAIKKAETKRKKSTVSLEKQEPIVSKTPKKVVFELSKTQVSRLNIKQLTDPLVGWKAQCNDTLICEQKHANSMYSLPE